MVKLLLMSYKSRKNQKRAQVHAIPLRKCQSHMAIYPQEGQRPVLCWILFGHNEPSGTAFKRGKIIGIEVCPNGLQYNSLYEIHRSIIFGQPVTLFEIILSTCRCWSKQVLSQTLGNFHIHPNVMKAPHELRGQQTGSSSDSCLEMGTSHCSMLPVCTTPTADCKTIAIADVPADGLAERHPPAQVGDFCRTRSEKLRVDGSPYFHSTCGWFLLFESHHPRGVELAPGFPLPYSNIDLVWLLRVWTVFEHHRI